MACIQKLAITSNVFQYVQCTCVVRILSFWLSDTLLPWMKKVISSIDLWFIVVVNLWIKIKQSMSMFSILYMKGLVNIPSTWCTCLNCSAVFYYLPAVFCTCPWKEQTGIRMLVHRSQSMSAAIEWNRKNKLLIVKIKMTHYFIINMWRSSLKSTNCGFFFINTKGNKIKLSKCMMNSIEYWARFHKRVIARTVLRITVLRR